MKQFFKSHYGITAVLLINLIFYVIIIFKVPWFMSDDFYIFYRVGENLKSGLFPKTNEEFYLFFRPLVYFSFVFDYLFLKNNPVGIKFITILFHIGFLSVFYLYLKNMCKLLNSKQNNLIIALILLIISLHPTTYNYIIWISSFNVALLNLFISCTLFLLSDFLIRKKNYSLCISVLFYIFACLSKQQAMAYPGFILLFYFIIRKNTDLILRKKLLRYISSVIIITIFFVVINGIFIESYDTKYFIMNFYKKPFVFFGTLYTIIFPLFQLEVYNFFTEHLFFTAFVSFILVSIIVFYTIKFKKQRKAIIIFLILWIISFFPQILVNNEFRNLNMQLLVFAFIFLIILSVLKNKIFLYTLLTLFIVFNFISTLQAVNKSRWNNLMNFAHYEKLNEIVNENENKYYVVIAYTNGLNLPYDYFYYKNNNFGKDNISGLELIWLLNNNTPEKHTQLPVKFSDVSVSGDTVIIKSFDKNVSIVGNVVLYNITESVPNSHKGFQFIKMLLPAEAKGKILIYYDGEKWIKI